MSKSHPDRSNPATGEISEDRQAELEELVREHSPATEGASDFGTRPLRYPSVRSWPRQPKPPEDAPATAGEPDAT